MTNTMINGMTSPAGDPGHGSGIPRDPHDRSRAARNYLQLSLAKTRQDEIARCVSRLSQLYKSRPVIFTGLTALKLCGIELPWHAGLDPDILHVLSSKDSARSHVVGFHFTVWQAPLVSTPWQHRDEKSILCTCPVDTWAILSRSLRQSEVIVLGDAILRAAQYNNWPITTELFRQCVEQGRRFPGIRKCRDALPFLRQPLDSSMEMRCVLVLLRYGLLLPETGYPIWVEELGMTVIVDMAYPEQRVIIEYDGDAHRWDRRQYHWDERKRSALRSSGYRIVVVFSNTFADENAMRAFAQEVAAALGQTIDALPQPEYRALMNDWITAQDCLRQRCRRRRLEIRGA